MVYHLMLIFQNKNGPTYQDAWGSILNNFQGSNLFWFKGSTHIGFSNRH